MNIVPAFAITETSEVASLIREIGFAQIVTNSGEEFVASSIPLVLHENRSQWKLIGHLAKTNPQAKLEGAHRCLVIFVGPNSYVSPTAYASLQETGKVVPTWNYVEVHLQGRLFIHNEKETLLDHVNELSDSYEISRDEPWKSEDAPQDYVEGLLKGIVKVEIEILSFQAKAKLSQNKSEMDRKSIVADLEKNGGASGIAVASLMKDAL
jgi:transcriptional regulator